MIDSFNDGPPLSYACSLLTFSLICIFTIDVYQWARFCNEEDGSPEKSGTSFEGQRDVRYYPTVINKTCRVLSTNVVSAQHRDVTNSLHTLLGKYLPANQSRHTRLVIL